MLIPLLAVQFMHPLMLAIFLVGLLAAIMSSADSALFAPAAIISNDLIRPWKEWKGQSYVDSDLTKWTRWSVAAIGVLATILGVMTESVFTLMVVGFTMQGGMLFFPLTLALYWKKANKWGGVSGMLSGAVVIAIMMIVQRTPFPEPFWALVFIPMLVSLVVMVVVSLATQKSCPPMPLMDVRTNKPVKWEDLAVQGKRLYRLN